MSKYGAIKTTVDGIKFDSKAEARHYQTLKCLERAGEISDLELQPKFDFTIPGFNKDKKIFTYKADFSYYKKGESLPTIEDVKGFETPVFRLKKKLIEALYPIKIELIK